MDHHFRFSSFREKLIEHLFVGELLKLSWQSGDCSLEVAKPEVDNSGYDVIVERDGIVRHIQLKASHRDAKAASQKVHVALGRKPSGCVVWVRFDTSTLDLGPFLFFGGTAGNPLPGLGDFKVARHTKADTQGIKAYRHDHREKGEKGVRFIYLAVCLLPLMVRHSSRHGRCFSLSGRCQSYGPMPAYLLLQH